MDKPMTTAEYFDRICGILREKGMMPDILDDACAVRAPSLMTAYPFRLKNRLDYFGEHNSVYLKLWAEYDEEDEAECVLIGIFKTRRSDREAMRAMGCLLADFVREEYAYRHAHLDDFIWKGANVYVFNGNGQRPAFGLPYESMAEAVKAKDQFLKKYPLAVVRNNRTRKETVYHAQ